MFKQLKIYKVTINTNESCMITNYYKMYILITISSCFVNQRKVFDFNFNELETHKLGFEIKEFHLNRWSDIVSFRFNQIIVTQCNTMTSLPYTHISMKTSYFRYHVSSIILHLETFFQLGQVNNKSTLILI